jgi:tetrahydromethanopterin S-methyltransferase subunit B
MINLSDLSRLSEKLEKVETLLENYENSMPIDNMVEDPSLSSFAGAAQERKFTMFVDLWVSSDIRVGR